MLFEQFHAKRFDIVELHGINTIEEDLYLNRTLAYVNNIQLLDNYQEIGPLQNLLWTTLLIIFVPVAIGIMIYVAKSMKRD